MKLQDNYLYNMITSISNSKIRHLSELNLKSRTRNKEGLFVGEGVRLFNEAPIELLTEIYIDEITYEEMKECSQRTPLTRLGEAFEKVQNCLSEGVLFETVSSDVFKKASDTDSPQGIIFVVKKPEYSLDEILGGNILILEDIQDPGNLGTMMRTAEGAGISGIIMSKGTVDLFNPKTVRATMGSLFRVPFIYTEDLQGICGVLKENNVNIYAAHLKGERFFDEIEYPGKTAFMIGNEGNGLSDEIADLADKYIKIPMNGQLESLNAAIAAALLMYRVRK